MRSSTVQKRISPKVQPLQWDDSQTYFFSFFPKAAVREHPQPMYYMNSVERKQLRHRESIVVVLRGVNYCC